MTTVDALRSALERLAVAPEDQQAWRTLYNHLWPFAVAVAYRRLKNANSAEEAAQEAFIQLWRARPFARIRDPDSLRAYLFRIAFNTSISLLRTTLAQGRTDRALAEVAEQAAPPDNDAGLLLEEMLALLRSELEPQDTKLLLSLLGGRSLAEAATDTGLTYSNAGVRLHRVRNRLRKLLKDNEKNM